MGEETGRVPTTRSRGRRGKRGKASTRRKGNCRQREVVSRKADKGEWGKEREGAIKGKTEKYSPIECDGAVSQRQ